MTQELRPWLVDVPTAINIWIRPHCQKEQFSAIRKARPRILFLISDCGRNEAEMKKVLENRTMVESQIDWDCRVYKIYSDTNLGMYQMALKADEVIWKTVDRCIFFEDDQIPSISFFQFCAELLEKYKDDLRISTICGMNNFGTSENVQSDYFFSPLTNVWGFATWKRTMDLFYNFSYGKDPYIMRLLNDQTRFRKDFQRKIHGYALDQYYQGHIAYTEFFFEFARYAHHQLCIVPKKNMITNIGYGDGAAHAPKRMAIPRSLRCAFDLPRYEVEFPLKHPQYVISDTLYERKSYDLRQERTAWQRMMRTLESKYLYLRYGGNLMTGIRRVMHRMLHTNEEIEK